MYFLLHRTVFIQVYLTDAMGLINDKASQQTPFIQILKGTDHPPTCTHLRTKTTHINTVYRYACKLATHWSDVKPTFSGVA